MCFYLNCLNSCSSCVLFILFIKKIVFNNAIFKTLVDRLPRSSCCFSCISASGGRDLVVRQIICYRDAVIVTLYTLQGFQALKHSNCAKNQCLMFAQCTLIAASHFSVWPNITTHTAQTVFCSHSLFWNICKPSEYSAKVDLPCIIWMHIHTLLIVWLTCVR